MSELKNRTFSDRYRLASLIFCLSTVAPFSVAVQPLRLVPLPPPATLAPLLMRGSLVATSLPYGMLVSLLTFFDRARSFARRCDTPRKPRCKHGPWGFLRRR